MGAPSLASVPAGARDPLGLTAYGKDRQLSPVACEAPCSPAYTLHLTVEAWLDAFPRTRQAEGRDCAEARGATGADLIVQLDAEGRPLRQVLALVPNSVELTQQVDFDGWGQVPVPEPPAGATVVTEGSCRCLDL